MDGLGIAVFALPVEIPVRNVDQRLRRAIRQDRVDVHPPAQVVGMRRDGDQVDIRGHGDPVVDLVAGIARRQVQRTDPGDHVRQALAGARSERQADGGKIALRLSGRVVVNLHDEVGLGFDVERHALAEFLRCGARRPASQRARRSNARPAEAGIALVRCGGGQFAALARAIEEEQRMVNHARIARVKLHRPGVALRGRGQRDHEAADDVGPVGRHGERLRGRQLHVGIARAPARGEHRSGQAQAAIAFGRPGGGPPANELDLLVGEAPFALEMAHPRLRLPRRHVPLLDRRGDQIRAPRRVLVGQQRERRDLARPVAGRAMRAQNGRDVGMKSGGRGKCRKRCKGNGDRGEFHRSLLSMSEWNGTTD